MGDAALADAAAIQGIEAIEGAGIHRPVLAFRAYDEGAPLAQFSYVHESLLVATGFLWLIAYASLLHKLRKDKGASGLSFQSLFALLVSEFGTLAVLVSILGWITFGNAMNRDATADVAPVSMLFLAEQVFVCFLVGISFLFAARNFVYSYNQEVDNFGNLEYMFHGFKAKARTLEFTGSPATMATKPGVLARFVIYLAGKTKLVNTEKLRATLSIFGYHWILLYLVAALLAVPLEYLRRSSLPQPLSFLETFIDLVLALALFPQLQVFHKQKPRIVSSSLARFVITMLLARLCSLVYWSTDSLFHTVSILPGRGVRIATEVANALVLVDFTYYYVKAKLMGLNDFLLPT